MASLSDALHRLSVHEPSSIATPRAIGSLSSRCQCDPPSAVPSVSAEMMEALWRDLRFSIRRQSPRFDSILGAIALSTAVPELPELPVAPMPAQKTRDDDDDAVDWVNGLGDDLLVIILRYSGMEGTGAAASACRTLRDIAMSDDIWRTHASRLDIDAACASTSRPCWAMCRDLCSRRRLGQWLRTVEGHLAQSGAALGKVNELLDDASRRLSRLQLADYREAQRTRNPPDELVFAARLLRALFGNDHDELPPGDGEHERSPPLWTLDALAGGVDETNASAEEDLKIATDATCHQGMWGGEDGKIATDATEAASRPAGDLAAHMSASTPLDHEAADEREAVAWFQRLLPQIANKRGEHANAEVAPFLALFFRYDREMPSAERLAAVEAILPQCCLKSLDISLEQRVRAGYPSIGDALRAARLASAVTRWVVGTTQAILLSRRERQLTTVAREIFRCRACVAPVNMLI